MASGKSLELQAIPKRTREWVIRHEVHDQMVRGKLRPVPANRVERRAFLFGRPWYGADQAQQASAKGAKVTLRRGSSAGVSNG